MIDTPRPLARPFVPSGSEHFPASRAAECRQSATATRRARSFPLARGPAPRRGSPVYRSSHATPHRAGRHPLPPSMPRAPAAARDPARGSGGRSGNSRCRAEAAARGWDKLRCPTPLPVGAAIVRAHRYSGSGIRTDVSRGTPTYQTRRSPLLPRPNLRPRTSRSSRSACADGHRALGRVAWTDRPRARLAAVTSIHSPSTATIAPVLGHTSPVRPSPSAPATTARRRDGVPAAATEWDAARRPCVITYPARSRDMGVHTALPGTASRRGPPCPAAASAPPSREHGPLPGAE